MVALFQLQQQAGFAEKAMHAFGQAMCDAALDTLPGSPWDDIAYVCDRLAQSKQLQKFKDTIENPHLKEMVLGIGDAEQPLLNTANLLSMRLSLYAQLNCLLGMQMFMGIDNQPTCYVSPLRLQIA